MRVRSLLLALCLSALLVLCPFPAPAETIKADSDLIGALTRYTVQPKDTLYKIARQFDVGIVALLSANPGVDVWVPRAGTELVIPAQHILPPSERLGIVINLSEMRLYYFGDARSVLSFPIGIGKDGWETVTGPTTITKKRKNPTWIPPESLREEDPTLPDMVPPGPDNPLGEYALNLGWEGYRIHGTNRPDGIGRRSSHGCVRLYPEDIAVLFAAVDVGLPVQVIDRDYKLGWDNDTLFLQATPTQSQSDSIVRRASLPISDIPEVYGDIQSIAGSAQIDWGAVKEAVRWRSGIPVAIARRK